jgi:hypothetical protein
MVRVDELPAPLADLAVVPVPRRVRRTRPPTWRAASYTVAKTPASKGQGRAEAAKPCAHDGHRCRWFPGLAPLRRRACAASRRAAPTVTRAAAAPPPRRSARRDTVDAARMRVSVHTPATSTSGPLARIAAGGRPRCHAAARTAAAATTERPSGGRARRELRRMFRERLSSPDRVPGLRRPARLAVARAGIIQPMGSAHPSTRPTRSMGQAGRRRGRALSPGVP